MTRRLFVTGTDTGVGKTRVATALVAAWAGEGRRVAVMKPAETGCAEVGGELVAEDATALARAAGNSPNLAPGLASGLASNLAFDPALVCPYRYAVPASPETAAALAGRAPPAVEEIARACARLADGSDVVVVEGAGGLLVPVAPGVVMADLAAALGATLLVVARTGLGTINHTLLTIEAVRRRGLPLAGVVLNQVVADAGPEAPHVAARIAEHGEVPILGTLPFGGGVEELRRAVDLTSLWNRLGG